MFGGRSETTNMTSRHALKGNWTRILASAGRREETQMKGGTTVVKCDKPTKFSAIILPSKLKTKRENFKKNFTLSIRSVIDSHQLMA